MKLYYQCQEWKVESSVATVEFNSWENSNVTFRRGRMGEGWS